jgi:nucleoside-diphosphate-sugar epimerase
MDGCDAVISLASRPSAANYVEEDVVKTNTMSMWNVCRAAEQLKVKRVALGSSYNAVGAMGTAARWATNEVKPPEYFPMDQNVYTRSEDPYSIAKWLGEEIGEAFSRRSPWMAIASMRFNGMWDDAYFKHLQANPISDPWIRCQGFWTYLHIRDAARACVQSVVNENWNGHHRFFLNAKDTMLNIPTMEAIKTVYPDVPLKKEFDGFEAPLSIQNVTDVIGWEPIYSWRDEQFSS